MAVNFGRNNGLGEFVESFGGASAFGSFGSAVFRSPERPRSQVWFISDGHDHIMATHICDRAPQAFEIGEAHQIATSLALGPDQGEDKGRSHHGDSHLS
jgi:hypothetical protein